MFNSTLDLRVPVTARPIGMLGGGGASSKGDLTAYGHHPHNSHGKHRFASPSTSTAAATSLPPGGCAVSTAGSSFKAKGNCSSTVPSAVCPADVDSSVTLAAPTPASTAKESPLPVNRPTITIITELEDEEDDGMSAARSWIGSTQGPLHAPRGGYHDPTGDMSGHSDASTMAAGLSRWQPSALLQTETTLSPLHYQSLCNHSVGEDSTGMLSSFERLGVYGAVSSNGRLCAEGGDSVRALDRNTQQQQQQSSHYGPAVAVTPNSPIGVTSSTTSHGPPQHQPCRDNSWSMGGGTPPDPHPVRISATPVVPIVPYVAEPASRRRVAEDLERLYGPNSRQQSSIYNGNDINTTEATSGCSSSPEPPANPTTAAAAGAGGTTPPGGECSDATGKTYASSLPVENPKKKRAFSFLPGSSSSKKTAKAATEAKKSVAPPTAAERRLAREQVIRVGVQRLYQRLNELHLVVYHVKNDGNCQFRAISHQLFGNEDYHDIIRSQLVSYMRAARAECFDFYFESPAQADAYYDNLAKPGSWGDELSLRAASDCLYVNIHVLSSEERNCYITYRPSVERAAYAPSFLIDVAKLRERRRAERRLLRSHGLQGGSLLSTTSLDLCATGYRGGDDNSGFGAAATMPDTYGRCRSDAPSALINNATSTLLTPSNASPAAAPVAGGISSSNSTSNRCNAARIGAQVPLTPLLPSSQPMSRNASGLVYGDDADDDAEVDVNAIQLALHKKLQQSKIRCSLPVGATTTAAKCTFHPGVCSTGGDYNSGHRAASARLLQPQQGIADGHGAVPLQQDSGTLPTLLRPLDSAVPVPCFVNGHESVTQDPKVNQMERFRAAGAEVQTVGDATQAVRIFTQRMEHLSSGALMDEAAGGDGYMRVQQMSNGMKIGPTPLTNPASRGTLLQPQITSIAEEKTLGGSGGKSNTGNNLSRNRPEPLTAFAASSSSMPYTLPQQQLMRAPEEPGEIMLLASNARRSNTPLQQSFSFMQSANSYCGYSGGSVYAESLNANPMHGSFSQSFAAGPGNAYSQPLDSLVPVSANEDGNNSINNGTDHMINQNSGDSAGAPVSFFKFEHRTEPIDIFLSYLYPVHYNSLSVLQPQQQWHGTESMNVSSNAMPASSLKNPTMVAPC